MKASDFPLDYRLKMIRAYLVIAQMDADEEYFATAAERDQAFERILANRNLQRTHQMFLAGQGERLGS